MRTKFIIYHYSLNYKLFYNTFLLILLDKSISICYTVLRKCYSHKNKPKNKSPSKKEATQMETTNNIATGNNIFSGGFEGRILGDIIDVLEKKFPGIISKGYNTTDKGYLVEVVAHFRLPEGNLIVTLNDKHWSDEEGRRVSIEYCRGRATLRMPVYDEDHLNYFLEIVQKVREFGEEYFSFKKGEE